jgi:hypothetical protein
MVVGIMGTKIKYSYVLIVQECWNFNYISELHMQWNSTFNVPQVKDFPDFEFGLIDPLVCYLKYKTFRIFLKLMFKFAAPRQTLK